jgi:hypothetical protein
MLIRVNNFFYKINTCTPHAEPPKCRSKQCPASAWQRDKAICSTRRRRRTNELAGA